MKLRKLITGLAVAATLGVSGTASAALAISPLFTGGLNTISDNNAELFRNRVGTCAPSPGTCTIDVGDIFLGGIEIDSINNIAIGTGSVRNELSGVFGVEVVAVIPIGPGESRFIFGAVGTVNAGLTLQAEFLSATGVDIGPTVAGATFARLWEDATPDATRDGSTFTNFITEVTDGTVALELNAIPGDVVATGPNDVSLLKALAAPGFGVPVSFSNGLFAGPDVVFDAFPSVQFVGNVGVSGNAQRPCDVAASCPLGVEDFTIRTDTTFTVNAVLVPEPTTLASLGIGLLALAGVARRRRPQA